MLSDRSTLRWGRRRPFILVGTLLNMACIIAIGASPGYWFLFGAVILSQIASNVAQGAEQGLIPDLVPEDRRGRFTGVKSVMELLPVIIVAFTVGPLVAAGQMWAGILVAIGILFLSMVFTMFVREEPLRASPGPLDWEPLRDKQIPERCKFGVHALDRDGRDGLSSNGRRCNRRSVG